LPEQRECTVPLIILFEKNESTSARFKLFTEIKLFTTVGLIYLAAVLVTDLTLAGILFYLLRRIQQGSGIARAASNDALESRTQNSMNGLVGLLSLSRRYTLTYTPGEHNHDDRLLANVCLFTLGSPVSQDLMQHHRTVSIGMFVSVSLNPATAPAH
jgi:hypothetical protein